MVASLAVRLGSSLIFSSHSSLLLGFSSMADCAHNMDNPIVCRHRTRLLSDSYESTCFQLMINGSLIDLEITVHRPKIGVFGIKLRRV
jgi:hypothetical protein